MKYLIPIALVLFILSSCKKDDFTLFLNYDGNNVTSPTLPAGTYELAARFPSEETNAFVGNQLKIVDFYMTLEPQFVRLKIYGEGDAGEPGNVLFSKEVSKDVEIEQWNRIELENPIEITGEDIWISLRVTLASQQQSVGCDAGPGNENGSFVYIDNSDSWTTYQLWAGESVNWNIRGGIE